MPPLFFSNALWLDNVSVSSSIPSLEPCSPSTDSQASSAGPDTPARLSDVEDDIVIITDRNKFDTHAAGNRLHESDAETQDVRTQAGAEDSAIPSPQDIDRNIVPSDLHDLDGSGDRPPTDCPHTGAAAPPPPPPPPPPAAATAPPVDTSNVLALPFHALGVAISFVFSSGTRALRHFYYGANQERVTVTTNWLSTDKLVEFASLPLQNERTPAWVKEHCSEWVVKEVVTCNGGNICGIDYKMRLIDNEIIWVRDDCLEWITGAVEAVRAFWAAGHCLRPDIAEKFLHQRPSQYCSLEWDAALLEWATRKVHSGHAYRIINGRVRSAA